MTIAPLHIARAVLIAAAVSGFGVAALAPLMALTSAPAGWPLAAQLALALPLADLALYGQHRAMHTRALWRFHRRHHEDLHVTHATQQSRHPVDSLAGLLAPVPVLALAGIGAPAAALAAGLIEAWGHLIHARLRFALPGLVTPPFHHMHHEIIPAGETRRAANFGSLFTIFDHLFGTSRRPGRDWPVTGV